VLYKPYDFDPNKKYPVVEAIYAGPYIAVVPRTFMLDSWPLWNQRVQAIAQLGFIVFTVDGRGTPERGKAFQDVVYRNYGRNEIPDHAATLKQLAGKRPYMDLSRVGILGHSIGGYFATRAMLLAPDVYHVGIAASVSEVDASPRFYYMDRPENNREGYEYASNLRLAGNLKGKLLLIHGTSDDGFSNTMKMVDAFIQAAKPYDLIVLPEGDHMSPVTANYSWEAIRRYFQEHLKP
jgi:dipeptidyl aminopeptidase/acylaminoacyl peptidase